MAGKACMQATGANEGQGLASCFEFACAYANLAVVPTYATWLFSVQGIETLKRLLEFNGTSSDEVRGRLGLTIAHCARVPQNQRVFLELFSKDQPTEEELRNAQSDKQRLALVKQQREERQASEAIRELLNELLRERVANPNVRASDRFPFPYLLDITALRRTC